MTWNGASLGVACEDRVERRSEAIEAGSNRRSRNPVSFLRLISKTGWIDNRFSKQSESESGIEAVNHLVRAADSKE